MIDDELKKQAIKLREQGMTYPQIVETLSGELSLDQCKYLLKGIKKKDEASELLDSVITLAKRPEGCTNAEVRQVVINVYGSEAEELLKDSLYISNIKRKAKARKGSEDVLFRPQWMKPDEAFMSLNEINTMAHCIFERLQEMAQEYCYEMDVPHKDSVIKEVVKLANNWSMPESLNSRVDRNRETAIRLSERIKQVEHKTKEYTAPYDEEFDKTCI